MTKSIRVSLLCVALGASGLLAAPIGPDAAGYTATDETAYGFLNIAPTGIRTLAGTDDDTSQAGLGFSFTFYAQPYTSVCVSTNGMMTFGGCADAFANQDLSATPTPGGLPVIAPFWTDLTFLQPNADAVYYETIGTAPSRQFIVQWNSAFPQNAPQPVTVQAVLYEGSNEIRFQYQGLDAGAGDPSTNGGTATVGICTANGRVDGRCLQWSYAAPVLHSEMAILFRPPSATTASLPGHMEGEGFLRKDGKRYQFAFEARERASGEERARFDLRVEADRRDDGKQKGNGKEKSDSKEKGDGKDSREQQGGGDRFRSRTVTSVVFSDDPTSSPGRKAKKPPMVDTVLFGGIGEWNGRPGYRYDVLATDGGEPGRHRESIRIRIWNPSGAPVVNVEGDLAGGNVQSERIKH